MATAPNIQLQSNSIRGEFKDAIVDKTIKEIHDVITTVFGPYATDAYALKDTKNYNKTYYTRDGKEVLKSLSFNNALANYVLSILNQAVDRQGSKIGDGTTTLAVLYTNLYKTLRNMQLNEHYSMTMIRNSWKKVVNRMNDLLASISTHDITPDMLASMIYTCTQDADLTKMFVDKVANKVMSGAYVTVNRSDSDTELEVVVNDKPLIKAELLSSMYHVEEFGSNCVPLFVNGALDIAHEETLQVLCEAVIANTPRNYVFICSGTTQATRNTLQLYMTKRNAYAKMIGKDPKEITNNIIVMKIPDFNMYPKDMVEDLAVYIYGTYGVTGIISPITFEALIWQTLKMLLGEQMTISVEGLETFDFDPKQIEMFRVALMRPCKIVYSEVDGMQIDLPMNPVAKERYEELRKLIDTEPSGVKRGEYLKRLKSLYGQFIEVNIGSKLLKDSQRKYELMLDAVLSAVNGITYGALQTSSICAAYCAANEVYLNIEKSETSVCEALCASVILNSIEKTIYDMAANAFPNMEFTQFDELLVNKSPFPVDKYKHCLQGITDPAERNFKFNLNRPKFDEIFDPEVEDEPIEVDGLVIKDTIVEPLPVITSLLENSIMMVELAYAKMFNIDTFIGNYI